MSSGGDATGGNSPRGENGDSASGPIGTEPDRWRTHRVTVAVGLVVLGTLMGPVQLVFEPSQRDSFANWYVSVVPVVAIASLVFGPRRPRLPLVALASVLFLLTPAATALVGDYSVGLMADGERSSSKTVELRVTVKAPTAWGWIGVGLIAVVIGGMGGLFAWLGRR